MSKIVETVREFFEGHGLGYEELEDGRFFRTGFAGANGQFSTLVDANDEEEILMCVTLCPVRVPEDRRAAVAEFLTRVNFRARVGGLVMEFDSGKIMSKTAVRFGKDELGEGTIFHSLLTGWLMMDLYFPAVNAVAFGKMSAKKALAWAHRSAEDVSSGLTRAKTGTAEKYIEGRFGGRLGEILDGSNN